MLGNRKHLNQVPAEAERIPGECEPVLVEDDKLRVLDLVEEELLLAIPLVPMHAKEACSMHASASEEYEYKSDPAEQGTANPFAILSNLKADKKS